MLYNNCDLSSKDRFWRAHWMLHTQVKIHSSKISLNCDDANSFRSERIGIIEVETRWNTHRDMHTTSKWEQVCICNRLFHVIIGDSSQWLSKVTLGHKQSQGKWRRCPWAKYKSVRKMESVSYHFKEASCTSIKQADRAGPCGSAMAVA